MKSNTEEEVVKTDIVEPVKDEPKLGTLARLFKKKHLRSTTKDYPIDGSTFDENNVRGIENSLSRKSINSDYKVFIIGYFGVTSISIAASVWGGFQLGTMLFIFMASAVELVKLILPTEAQMARILASAFSFVIGCFAFYMALLQGNAAIGNQESSEKMLITSIQSIDDQLRNLGTSGLIKVSAPTTTGFDNRGYNRLIAKLAGKRSELDRLKVERHTYWQARPNKRNKRTGQWMLDNVSKCTGSFCKKLYARRDLVVSLEAQKVELDKGRVADRNMESMALQAQMDATKVAQSREKAKQKLMVTRMDYQSQLLKMNSTAAIEQPIAIIMFLIVTFLILIEFAQGTFKESSSSLKSHRRRTNLMYKNYISRAKEKAMQSDLKQVEVAKNKKSGWFKTDNVESQAISTDKVVSLTQELAQEIKMILEKGPKGTNRFTRSKVYSVFGEFGIGKSQKNFNNFKTMIGL